MEGILILSDIVISVLNTGDVDIEILNKLKSRLDLNSDTLDKEGIIQRIYTNYITWLNMNYTNISLDEKINIFKSFSEKIEFCFINIINIKDITIDSLSYLISEEQKLPLDKRIIKLEQLSPIDVKYKTKHIGRLLNLYLSETDINSLDRIIQLNKELKNLINNNQ